MKKILQLASCRGTHIFDLCDNVDIQMWMDTPFSTLTYLRIGFESLYMLNNPPQHDMLHVEIPTLTYCLKNTYQANLSSMLLTDEYISPEDSRLNYQQFEKYMDYLISMVPDHVRLVIQTSHNIQLSDRHCNLIKQSIMNKEHKNLMRGGAGVKEEILAEKLTPCKRFRNRTDCENHVIKYFNKHKHRTIMLKTSEIFNGWDSEAVFNSSDDQHVDTFHYNEEAVKHFKQWVSDLNL
jgi:hypothetical protein